MDKDYEFVSNLDDEERAIYFQTSQGKQVKQRWEQEK